MTAAGRWTPGKIKMNDSKLEKALETLGEQFAHRNWKYIDVPPGSQKEKSYEWPGASNEKIMICVHKGPDIQEMFHRQEFFFFNFAYRDDYGALSYRYDNHITVHENECYIGQPFAGYALYAHSQEEIIIIGVLIQKEAFFKTCLPVLSADANLFRFFLTPQTDEYAEEFIHLRFDDSGWIRSLLEMMVMEYADPQPGTQDILQPMVLTLLMLIARQYRRSTPAVEGERLSEQIIRYIGEHADVVSLKEIAKHFSYHPNYVSALLHRETGKSFSEILLEQRMERAVSLINGTTLSIEEIAAMLGYSNSSNFYKAFKKYFGISPRKRDKNNVDMY